jgi:hypothetical protein
VAIEEYSCVIETNENITNTLESAVDKLGKSSDGWNRRLKSRWSGFAE